MSVSCWWLLIPAFVLYFPLAFRRRKQARAAVLAWLRANPGWHYAPEIREALHLSRSYVYIILGDLDDEGVLDTQLIPQPYSDLPRTQYRFPSTVNGDA